ncbi:MAG: hypothetical protein LUC29_09405 [Acidaminococcaceae bacterium]|nr:hypothetical protein [Acidaminococcaceae bacterium]
MKILDKMGNLSEIFKEKQLHVAYKAHMQDFGWQPEAADGATAGKPESGKRLEAIQVRLPDAPQGAGIRYCVHVAGKGWLPEAADGAVGGTTGESRRAEAVKMHLVGCEGYTVFYRVFMHGKGWSGWCSNG